MTKEPESAGEQDFARFLIWLNPDPDSAADAYNDFQRRLTVYFLGRGCGMWAEDLASQALDRTAQKFQNGCAIEDREPGKYLFQVAGFILLEHFKKPRVTPLAPDMLITVQPVEDKPEVRCCKGCLAQLSEEDRNVLQDYYQGFKQGEPKRIRGDVASDLRLQRGTLRVRVFRLKQNLLKCMAKCAQRDPLPM